MCRHIGYLGPPVALAGPLLDAPHSLLVQSYAPNDMRCPAKMNADGFGVGWYTETGGEPLRYRRSDPLWSDQTLPTLARQVRALAILAAARSASVGMPVMETASAPFTDGRWLFSLNGMVAGWPDSAVDLASELDIRQLMTIEAPTDSALLWAWLRHRFALGQPAELALTELTATLSEIAPGSRLNLMLTDGRTLYATAWWHSLSVLRLAGDAVVVASEPYDADPGWEAIPDRHILVASASSFRVDPIGSAIEESSSNQR
ncbi:MAG: ergothioneine biosynthesis protein EgtC [Sciscionella sp.]